MTFFTYASNEATLVNNVDGFAEAALARANVPTVHFINLRNHWWHIPDLEECMSAAEEVLKHARNRTGYGSSMGAYAALRFSGHLNLNSVLAFVPQFSVSRELVPFETRWARADATLTFRGEPYTIPSNVKCHIVIGNCEADHMHIQLIQKANPKANITLHEVAAGDHLILKSYQEEGLIGGIVESLPQINVQALKRHPFYKKQSTNMSDTQKFWLRLRRLKRWWPAPSGRGCDRRT